MKKILFFLSLFGFIAIASQASALTRYQSRDAFYLELGGNIGGGYSYFKQLNKPQLVLADRAVDFGFNVGAGFGMNENITFGGQIFTMMQPQSIYKMGQKQASRFLFNGDALASLNLYLFGGFVLEGAAGLAFEYYSQTGKVPSIQDVKEVKVGLGAKGSLGYEGFISPTSAIGARFYYLYNYFQKYSHDSFGVQVYLRFY